MENVIYDHVEKWAVRFAEGFVDGRSPLEEQVRLDDYVSRLTFPISLERELPTMRVIDVQPPSTGESITAGPFKGLLSVKIPKVLSDLFGLPTGANHAQLAKVVSVRTKEPVIVRSIPTCTSKNIFENLGAGKRPPHPVIQFTRPIGRVHVKMTNDRDQLLWDATYDLKGGRLLSNKASAAIPEESLVPEYIPPCAVGQSQLKLEIDAEKNSPIRIEFYNPNNQGEAARYREEMLRSRPPESNVPQEYIDKADAVVCKVNLINPAKKVLIDTARRSKGVHIPPSLANQLWRFDKTREETSSLNPHGVPMMDMTGGRIKMGPVLDPELAKMAPMALGSGKNAVHLIPRRPPLGGEIQADQLERYTFHLFDSHKMPVDVRQVDRSAILHKPGGFHQPTVNRTVYSPMWQGIHGTKGSDIHPSFQFKHPASSAHVRLVDLTGQKLLWDAFFDLKGNHKLAADQVPMSGLMTKFKGINPITPRTHKYSLTVDVDNPADLSKIPGERLASIWRYSEFLFGANRPVDHSDVGILVKTAAKPSPLIKA